MASPRLRHIAQAALCLHRTLGVLLLIALAVCPADAVAPTVSSFITPSDNATGVSESTSLIVQFDQNVVKGSSGNITIKKYSDDSTVETIAVTSGSVTAAGSAFVTITLSTLGFGTRYYVFIDANALENGSAEGFAGISNKDTWDFTTKDNDGTLVASGTVSEPIALASTVTTTGAAVDIFDFTLTDGGASDGLALAVTQVVLNTSGTGPFAKVTFRLNGPDAANVTGTYSSGANTLTFTGLTLSVADGASETYTINAYYNDNTSLTENQTLVLSTDGDTDLTVSGTGTQMSGSNAAIGNGSGTTVSVTATQLVLNTAPADTRQVDANDEVLSGSAFQTQPVIRAHDAAGNLDVDFSDLVVASKQSGSGQIGGTSSATASAGIATFADLRYDAASDGESFVLSFDDQASGSEGDLTAIAGASLSADVVASQWAFSRQPSAVLSGLAAGTQPEVQARDAQGITDLDFTQTATLALNTSDSVENGSATASAGTATFSGFKITGIGQSRILTASGGSIASATSNSFDVGQAQATVSFTSATHVVFDGQQKSLMSTSDPAGLNIVTTYNGFADPPTEPGTYQVVATVNDAIYAGTATGTLIIQPPGMPVAVLQATPQEGSAPLTVTFTNASEGFGFTFLETFNSSNQTFDNPESVQATYDTPGTYEAVLTIKGQGGTNQTTSTIVVHGPPILQQTITAPAATPAGEAQILDLTGLDQEAGTWLVDLMGPGPVTHTEISDERVSFIADGDMHGTQEIKITRTNPWGLSTSQQLQLTWTESPDPVIPDDTAESDSQASTSPETEPTTAGQQNPGKTGPTENELPVAPPVESNTTDNATATTDTDANTAPSPDPAADTAQTDGVSPPSNDATEQADGDIATNNATATTEPTPDQTPLPSIPQETTFFDAAGEPVHGLFDDDLQVEFDDYFLFADRYGSTSEQSGYDPRFDLDGDGVVGLADFFLFADSFGKEAVAP